MQTSVHMSRLKGGPVREPRPSGRAARTTVQVEGKTVASSGTDEGDVKEEAGNLSSAMTILQALEYIGGDRSRRLSDIVLHLGRPKSTVLRLLDTLVRAGFVKRIAPGEYGVTIKLWRLGTHALDGRMLESLILPAIKKMTIDTGESGLYAIYENGFSVFVEKVDSPQPVAASVAIGARAPAFATATGKSMLAFQTPDEIERVLRSATVCTKYTITDYDKLQRQLAEVRSKRIAFSFGEWREDIAGAAAPVFDRHDQIVGAIGISCPRGRVEQRLKSLGEIVRSAAIELSGAFGASGAPGRSR